MKLYGVIWEMMSKNRNFSICFKSKQNFIFARDLPFYFSNRAYEDTENYKTFDRDSDELNGQVHGKQHTQSPFLVF